MIQDASRRRVQPARSATIAGSATAVIMSSRPARNTPVPSRARSTYDSRRVRVVWACTPGSVGAITSRGFPQDPALRYAPPMSAWFATISCQTG